MFLSENDELHYLLEIGKQVLNFRDLLWAFVILSYDNYEERSINCC